MGIIKFWKYELIVSICFYNKLSLSKYLQFMTNVKMSFTTAVLSKDAVSFPLSHDHAHL